MRPTHPWIRGHPMARPRDTHLTSTRNTPHLNPTPQNHAGKQPTPQPPPSLTLTLKTKPQLHPTGPHGQAKSITHRPQTHTLTPHPDPNRTPQNHAGKQKEINCDTRDALQRIYGPLNDELYALLDAHHKAGLTPPEEPRFSPFALMPCA